MKTRFAAASAGFSLVLSLIILTLLAILVVGFLSSTAMDRATAHAFSDKAKAEAAAGTAANQAMSMLREYIAQYPDSATMWETLTPSGGGPGVEGTVLYYNDQPPPNGIDPSSLNVTPQRYVLPLMSRGTTQARDANGVIRDVPLLTPVPVTDKANALGRDAWHEAYWNNGKSAPDCIDLNRPQSNEDKTGWVGATPDGRRPYYAKWVEVKEKTNADGKTDEGKDPKTVSRYAFWVEDESFKLNLNLLGADKRGSEALENSKLRTNFTVAPTPAPLPTQLAAFVPTQGLLRSARAPASIDSDTVAGNVAKLRTSFLGGRLPDLRTFNQLNINEGGPSGSTAYRLGDETKFLATAFSGSLNLSRHGSQRLNLNALGFEKPNLNPVEKGTQISEVVETIKFHAPRFGQRFYRTSTINSPNVLNAEQVTEPLHRNIYLHKVATNIRDYIDPDFLPTIVMDPGGSDPQRKGKILLPQKPMQAMFVAGGENPVWAQGKDSGPFLQEAVVRFRSDSRGGKFSLKVDYYLEFWNMTNRPIAAADLSGDQAPGAFGTFVEIIDAPGWVHVGGSKNGDWLEADNSPAGDVDDGRRLTIDLITGVRPNQNPKAAPVQLVFQPGVTVITTDPDPLTSGDTSPYSAQKAGGSYSSTTYYCENISGKREFTGSLPSGTTAIKPAFRDTTSKVSDYHTEVYMGNNYGYIDAHPYAVAANVQSVSEYTTSTSLPPRDLVFGGSLLGNGSSPSQLGDPRTNNEALTIERYMAGGMGGEPDQARYANPGSTAPTFTLGLPNWSYVNPHLATQWPDYYKGWDKNTTATVKTSDLPTDKNAPMYVANAPMVSIGQLGDVFDPARVQGAGTLRVRGSRGGGRTFRIGQGDDRIDVNTPGALSNQWASWRLTDFFSTTSDLWLPGTINLNGIARDNGAALRAAFYGLTVEGIARAATNNSTLKSSAVEGADWKFNSDEKANVGIQKVIDAALERMNKNDPAKTGYDASKPYRGPFMERGEFSDLSINNLNIYNVGSNVVTDKAGTAIDMGSAFDRTREAVFRRLVELTTTRGSVFSVYALGESITEDPLTKVKRVTGSHRVKVTFKLVPKTSTGADFGVAQQEFDPTDSEKVRQRFSRPDHYDIQILQVSS